MKRVIDQRETIDLLLPIGIPVRKFVRTMSILESKANLGLNAVSDFAPQGMYGLLRLVGDFAAILASRHQGKKAIGQTRNKDLVCVQPALAQLEIILWE